MLNNSFNTKNVRTVTRIKTQEHIYSSVLTWVCVERCWRRLERW